eukprot:8245264-Pyramimonas_sp.AAC.1
MPAPRELSKSAGAARSASASHERGRCKKGASCKQRHGAVGDQVNEHLPRASRARRPARPAYYAAPAAAARDPGVLQEQRQAARVGGRQSSATAATCYASISSI